MAASPPLASMLLLVSLYLLATAAGASPTTRPRALLQDATDDPATVDAQKAAEFCKSPAIKTQSCGWAPEGEPGRFSTGGTVWGGGIEQSALPVTFGNLSTSFKQEPPRTWVSLACRPGKLVVRVVFKMTDLPADGLVGTILNRGLAAGTLGSNPSPVTRCDLQLPAFTTGDAKSETAAALKSTEVNCRSKSDALKANSWYSDTLTFDWAGCPGASKPGAKYTPTVPYLIHNPGVGFIVAKFEMQEAK